MLVAKKSTSLLSTLILLTCLAIFTQILFLWVNSLTSDILDSFVSASLTQQILHSKIVIIAFTQFVINQIIMYVLYVSMLWYVANAVGELFALSERLTYIIGVLLWFVSAILILLANTYYVPHSFFSTLVQKNIFNGSISHHHLKAMITISEIIVLIYVFFAVINLLLCLGKKQNVKRHLIALFFVLGFVSLIVIDKLDATPQQLSTATTARPNIIIVGVDALRPDFTSFYNQNGAHTPHLDAFLKVSVNFSEAYTPLARTFPSWTSILTGAYPIHTNARGNNTDIDTIRLDETLPRSLQQAKYETIFGTDDTRFNNVNQRYGFDSLISPPMGLNDFLIGSLNDFPLSNLLIPTPIGKLLFPYNFANHGTANTYSPNNYLELINDRLHNRSQKPLFLSIHFTLSHWPFYWFNDHQPMNRQVIDQYKTSIEAADKQVGEFFDILQKNHLLDHAIVVLLSDHGLTFGLPGDTVLQKQFYQGQPANLYKVPMARYDNAPERTTDYQHDYGVDTCYGYGNNLLSLHQAHALLGIKGYGIDVGTAHTVTQRVSMMDIAPTVLDVLHLPALQHADGLSLKSYLFNLAQTPNNTRPFYFETTFTLPEIERNNISVDSVVSKTINSYLMHPKSGLIYFNHDAEKSMISAKQFGILEGDWLLVHFPETQRGHLKFPAPGSKEAAHIEMVTVPAFLVLVNLKTGEWTTEMNSPFAAKAPVVLLVDQLDNFFDVKS